MAMPNKFEPLIKKKEHITHLDDSLLQSQTKAEMFMNIHEYHQLLRKGGLKAAPDTAHFFLRKYSLALLSQNKGFNRLQKE